MEHNSGFNILFLYDKFNVLDTFKQLALGMQHFVEKLLL